MTASITSALTALLRERRAAKSLSLAELAKAAGCAPATIASRFDTGKGWEITEVYGLAPVLGIRLDELAEILFPDREGGAAELVRLEHELGALHDENLRLRDGRFEAQAVIRDIVRTGKWAVSIIPNMVGPTPSRRILASVRLSVAPLSTEDSMLDVVEMRRMFVADVRKVENRVIWLSGKDMKRPSIPGIRGRVVEGQTALDMSVAVYDENRSAAALADRTRIHHRGRGIVVVGTTTGAWTTETAAVIGRSLGWGLMSMQALARASSSPADVGTGSVSRAWLRDTSARQLHNTLLDRDRDRETVYSHWGYAATDADGSRHPLVRAIEAAADDTEFPELPFVVMLREDDDLLTQYGNVVNSDQGSVDGKEDRFRASRDALWQAVTSLPSTQRLIVPVRAVTATDVDEISHETWMRTVTVADTVLRHLLKADALRIADKETALIMSALPGRGD